ncbi:MAG: hypothetical protein VX777_09460 [Chlamydiota bacterium]|nr:hypothetical protein [Chlamydiota bacterium]
MLARIVNAISLFINYFNEQDPYDDDGHKCLSMDTNTYNLVKNLLHEDSFKLFLDQNFSNIPKVIIRECGTKEALKINMLKDVLLRTYPNDDMTVKKVEIFYAKDMAPTYKQFAIINNIALAFKQKRQMQLIQDAKKGSLTEERFVTEALKIKWEALQSTQEIAKASLPELVGNNPELTIADYTEFSEKQNEQGDCNLLKELFQKIAPQSQ